jgi:hypothetical protein
LTFEVINIVILTKPKIPTIEITAIGNIRWNFIFLTLFGRSTINLAAEIQITGNSNIKWKKETKSMTNRNIRNGNIHKKIK